MPATQRKSIIFPSRIVAIGLCAISLLTGCSSSKVSDWRHGDGHCDLHERKMDTVIVHGIAGPAPQMVPGYYDAKEQTFPNCGIEYPAEMYGDERGKIYVCPICETNRQTWSNSQNDG